MKKYSWIIGVVLFAIVVYWFFVKPQFDSPKIGIAGKVVSITKMKRTGDHLIEIRENEKLKFIYYTFFNDDFDIRLGDSLFKKPFGKLFVKNELDTIMRLAKDQNILISE